MEPKAPGSQVPVLLPPDNLSPVVSLLPVRFEERVHVSASGAEPVRRKEHEIAAVLEPHVDAVRDSGLLPPAASTVRVPTAELADDPPVDLKEIFSRYPIGDPAMVEEAVAMDGVPGDDLVNEGIDARRDILHAHDTP